MTIKLSAAASTDLGGRSSQQDSYLICSGDAVVHGENYYAVFDGHGTVQDKHSHSLTHIYILKEEGGRFE